MNCHTRIITQVSLSSHSMFLDYPVLLLSTTSRSPFSNASPLLYANLQAKLLESGEGLGGVKKGDKQVYFLHWVSNTAFNTQLHNHCCQHTERSQEHAVTVAENSKIPPFKHKESHTRGLSLIFNGFRLKINMVLFSSVEIKSKQFSETMSLENACVPEESL